MLTDRQTVLLLTVSLGLMLLGYGVQSRRIWAWYLMLGLLGAMLAAIFTIGASRLREVSERRDVIDVTGTMFCQLLIWQFWLRFFWRNRNWLRRRRSASPVGK